MRPKVLQSQTFEMSATLQSGRREFILTRETSANKKFYIAITLMFIILISIKSIFY